MGAMQRNKGAAGERAVASLIRDWLGLDVRRNWQGPVSYTHLTLPTSDLG